MKSRSFAMQLVGDEPAKTWKQGLKTGYSHPKCYASILNDCDSVLTREHFISDTILAQIENLTVSGMSWIREGDSKKLPASALTSNILCERHNNLLSDLDQRIGIFFRTVRKLSSLMNEPESELKKFRIHKAFWGWDLERWLLKTMIGIYFSGNMRNADGTFIPKSGNVSSGIIEALFSSSPWPSHVGLYNIKRVGTRLENNGGITVAPIFNADKKSEIIGADFTLVGFPLTLVMARVPDLDYILHHPKAFEFRNGQTARKVSLLWES